MAIIKKIASQDYVTTEASSIANDVVDVKLESHVVSWDKIVDTPFSEQEDGRITLNETHIPDTIARVSDIPDVSAQIDTHNTATDSHNDIRLLVDDLTTRLNTLSNIDYDAILAFDTSEVIFGTNTTTSVLGQAILGQMVLA